MLTLSCRCASKPASFRWYLQDNDASYYFLLNYRVFAQLENYKGSKQRPELDKGFREQLAQECEAYLTRIIMRVRALFPELQELSDYPTVTG